LGAIEYVHRISIRIAIVRNIRMVLGMVPGEESLQLTPGGVSCLSTFVQDDAMGIGLILTIFFFVLISGIRRDLWFSTPFTPYALTASAVFWICRYQIGIYQNLKYSSFSKPKKVLFHLAIIFLAPFIDLICNLPPLLTAIKPPKSFELTAKRT
jgi:hypothetical protein